MADQCSSMGTFNDRLWTMLGALQDAKGFSHALLERVGNEGFSHALLERVGNEGFHKNFLFSALFSYLSSFDCGILFKR